MAEFVSSKLEGDVCSLAVSGEIDIETVEGLLEEGRACLASAAATLEIDLAGVTFIDSSGLGALVRLRNEAAEQGRGIQLVRVPSTVVRLLEVTGLAQAFPTRAGE